MDHIPQETIAAFVQKITQQYWTELLGSDLVVVLNLEVLAAQALPLLTKRMSLMSMIQEPVEFNTNEETIQEYSDFLWAIRAGSRTGKFYQHYPAMQAFANVVASLYKEHYSGDDDELDEKYFLQVFRFVKQF